MIYESTDRAIRHKLIWYCFSWELDRWKTLLRESGWDEVYKVTEHWCYESLLMQLSVKDNPIEFLISILK